MNFKALLVGAFATAVMCVGVYAQSDVKVFVDSEPLECDVPAQIIEGRTMLPVRAVFESVGMDVDWDEDTKTVTGKGENTEIEMTIGETTVYVNGEKQEIDVPALIVDGRTLAPVRFVGENAGYNVNWDEVNKQVFLELNVSDEEDEPATEYKETATEATTQAVTKVVSSRSRTYENVESTTSGTKTYKQETTTVKEETETTTYDRSFDTGLTPSLYENVKNDLGNVVENYKPGSNNLSDKVIEQYETSWKAFVSTTGDKEYLKIATDTLKKLNKAYAKIDDYSKKNRSDSLKAECEDLANTLKVRTQDLLNVTTIDQAKVEYSELVADYSDIVSSIDMRRNTK